MPVEAFWFIKSSSIESMPITLNVSSEAKCLSYQFFYANDLYKYAIEQKLILIDDIWPQLIINDTQILIKTR